ncbi:ABC transporter substrate-binding protein [Croceicoccus estronivorus]|nr:ABC transporter substrate-binding protein [Croceicoccus estronivorus]
MERQVIKGIRFDRRGFALALTTVLLAGCAIVPKGTGTVGPAQEPDATVLPDDDGRHRIALLVPLSGSNGEVGQSIANATTMALLDTNASNLRITTYDTATGAESAAAKAMTDGNRLILGPLLGENTRDVVKVARRKRVPLISFSNDITTAARDVFLMGHIPSQSIGRTVDYAFSHGSRRFSALIPNGEYGRQAELALSSAVLREGAALMAVEKYDRGSTAVIEAAKRLEAKGPFDSVLIADGARLSALAANQFTKKPQILGTELWSGESSVTANASLRGALFSAVSDGRYKQFASSYKARFGNQPYRISTLGYDAVLLTLKIARDWKPGTSFPTAKLLDKGGFLGVDGPFRFLSNGVGERAMEVRKVGNGAVSVVSPAPARFDD